MAALESHGAVAVPTGFKAGAITAGLAAGGGGVVATTTAGLSAAAKWAVGAVAAAALVCSVALLWSRWENDRLRAELAGDTPEAGGVASVGSPTNPAAPAARSAPGGSAVASRAKRPFPLHKPAMILAIPNVLNPQQLADARRLLDSAEWTDGAATAGHQAVKVKDNMQIPATHPVAKQVGETIVLTHEGLPGPIRVTLHSVGQAKARILVEADEAVKVVREELGEWRGR